MEDFFFQPYKITTSYAEISIKIDNVGLNDRPKRVDKKYLKQKIQIDFNTIIGDRRSWSEQSIDAVANFIRYNDVYMNRVRIVEVQFNKSYTGTVYVECYMMEGKHVR